MSRYPGRKTAIDASLKLASDATGVAARNVSVVAVDLTAAEAAAADTDGVLAAVQDDGSQQVITTGLTNPPYPRNITATAGGTTGDIKAISVIVEGTNINDEPITETLPAFTADTTGTVQGSLAFKTVTKVTIPAHDGTGATTEIGWGDKLGLPFALQHGNTVLHATLNGVREATAPTVAADNDEIEKNTVDLNSALNGTPVSIYVMV